jgi:ABC-type hemin transport system substrate-binding protein
VVASGLVGGAAGLAIALFLRTVVAHTPARISEHTLFWDTVLVSGFGLVAGMAVEAVGQLQRNNPDPEYHRGRRSGRRGSPQRPRR